MFAVAPQNTGATLYAQTPELQKIQWSQVADMFEKDADPFQSMEGGPDQVIETIKSLAAGNGHIIKFPIHHGYHNEPKMGEERFTAQTDYATDLLASNELRIDYVRWAWSGTEREEEHMGMRGEIFNRVPEKLGRQAGEWKSRHTQMCLLHKTNAENRLIATAAGARNSTVHELVSADTLRYDEIVTMAAMMEPMGGAPAHVGRDAMGNAIFGQVVIPTTQALASLKADATYRQNLREAGERGPGNVLFSGGVQMTDGHVIRKYNSIDHAEQGAIGCPLMPRARLGTAITTGTGALNITGGGNATDGALTHILYFQDFPKYQYRFRVDDVLSATAGFWDLNGSNNFYVVGINPATATTDPGKFCLFEISANNGNVLTVTKKLGAAIAGIVNTTVGALTFSGSVHTEVLASNALIYLASEDGLPLFCTPMLGKRALRRAYGKHRNLREDDQEEGSFIKQTYMRTIFGQNVRSDRSTRVPSVMLLKHTAPLPGWNVPTVT